MNYLSYEINYGAGRKQRVTYVITTGEDFELKVMAAHLIARCKEGIAAGLKPGDAAFQILEREEHDVDNAIRVGLS